MTRKRSSRETQPFTEEDYRRAVAHWQMQLEAKPTGNGQLTHEEFLKQLR